MKDRRALWRALAWALPFAIASAIAGPARGQGQTTPMPRKVRAEPAAEGLAPLGLDDLVRLGLGRNPALPQAGFEVDAARGRAVQAGLYPNPTISAEGQELGSPRGPGGMITAPMVSQQIVTAGKLGLSRSVAEREVDQAGLALLRQRFVLLTAIRQGYFAVLAARRRVEVLAELTRVAEQSYEVTRKRLEAKQAARLDLLQVGVEMNRVRADLDAARRELAAAWRRLAATVGVPDLPEAPLAGTLEAPLPDYDFDHARALVLEAHPEVQSARVGVARAELALRRAQAEPVPNVSVGAGYMRQNKDREDDWMFQVSLPVPVWNRNQGNIRAAQAEVGRAAQEVGRVQLDLARRLATAFGEYAAARERTLRYRGSILPDSREAFQIALAAFRAGQVSYLQVLQAQRTVQEANLEYVRNLADAWRGASEIAGLLLEEQWPLPAPSGRCGSEDPRR
jgi:outer membrane protein, heavy metal efflux system